MKGVLHLVADDLEEGWIPEALERLERWLLVWS